MIPAGLAQWLLVAALAPGIFAIGWYARGWRDRDRYRSLIQSAEWLARKQSAAWLREQT